MGFYGNEHTFANFIISVSKPPVILHSQTSSKQNSTSIELKNIWFEMGILKW